MNSKLIVSALLALTVTPAAQAASCNFKLEEAVPVARVTLQPGAEFTYDAALNLTFDRSKVVKEEKLNGSLFKGVYEGLQGNPGDNVAIYVDTIERASGHLDFETKCKSAVFTDGYCNVQTVQNKLAFAILPTLDKVTYRKSVKDAEVGYMINAQINPKTGMSRILLMGMAQNDGGIAGGHGTVNVYLAPGEKTPAKQTLVVSFVNDALWYELGNGNGKGPRVAELTYNCQN